MNETMKQIDVIASAKYVDKNKIMGSTPVVIDVLRATSVMVTAFEYGVKEIIPVMSSEEAFQIKSSSKSEVILGGERSAEIIPGFDYDNSPSSYMNSNVKGKTLVMTTTNGTSAIKAAEHAGDVLIASFLNAGEVISRLKDFDRITLVCSGTNGNYTLEDGLCAGYIIDGLMQLSEANLTDFAQLVHSFYQNSKDDIRKAASVAKHYKVLKQKGFNRDLEYCFKTDESRIVPVCRDGVITKKTGRPIKSTC
jgi:2-phosphosulfolactate phosphatase